jgi:sec-independent protein translocase protein TatA
VPVTLLLFGPIGTTELIIIAVIILLLFGSRLPNVMRNLGKGVTSFKAGLKEGKEEEESDSLGPPKKRDGE